jgi:hypothetical protein
VELNPQVKDCILALAQSRVRVLVHEGTARGEAIATYLMRQYGALSEEEETIKWPVSTHQT